MQQTRARQILQSLIQGIDPVTREELPRETVLQHADVLRALLAGLSVLAGTQSRVILGARRGLEGATSVSAPPVVWA